LVANLGCRVEWECPLAAVHRVRLPRLPDRLRSPRRQFVGHEQVVERLQATSFDGLAEMRVVQHHHVVAGAQVRDRV
jgi:hypothetical protein